MNIKRAKLVDELEKEFAHRISNLRYRHNFESHERFAYEVNRLLRPSGSYDSPSVSRWLNGTNIPRRATVDVIDDVLTRNLGYPPGEFGLRSLYDLIQDLKRDNRKNPDPFIEIEAGDIKFIGLYELIKSLARDPSFRNESGTSPDESAQKATGSDWVQSGIIMDIREHVTDVHLKVDDIHELAVTSALSSKKLEDRIREANRLGKSMQRYAIPLLSNRLEIEPDPEARGPIINAIADIGGPEAKQALTTFAQRRDGDMDKFTRLVLKEALARLDEG